MCNHSYNYFFGTQTNWKVFLWSEWLPNSVTTNTTTCNCNQRKYDYSPPYITLNISYVASRLNLLFCFQQQPTAGAWPTREAYEYFMPLLLHFSLQCYCIAHIVIAETITENRLWLLTTLLLVNLYCIHRISCQCFSYSIFGFIKLQRGTRRELIFSLWSEDPSRSKSSQCRRVFDQLNC